jgi:hypothetical protein
MQYAYEERQQKKKCRKKPIGSIAGKWTEKGLTGRVQCTQDKSE